MADQGITQGREPRRGPIQQVVQARRRPTETPVALGTVAPHGVQGVGQPIEEDAGCPRHQKPEEGTEDGVVAVFQHGFDRRLGNGRFIQVGGVATDQVAHRLAGLGQVATGQGIAHPAGVFSQAAPADGEIEHQEVQGGAPGPGR